MCNACVTCKNITWPDDPEKVKRILERLPTPEKYAKPRPHIARHEKKAPNGKRTPLDIKLIHEYNWKKNKSFMVRDLDAHESDLLHPTAFIVHYHPSGNASKIREDVLDSCAATRVPLPLKPYLMLYYTRHSSLWPELEEEDRQRREKEC